VASSIGNLQAKFEMPDHTMPSEVFLDLNSNCAKRYAGSGVPVKAQEQDCMRCGVSRWNMEY
jgi:hypothetical protein